MQSVGALGRTKRDDEVSRDLASRVITLQLGAAAGAVVDLVLRSADGKTLKELEVIPDARTALVLLWKHGLLGIKKKKYHVSCRRCCERLGFVRCVDDLPKNVGQVVEYLVGHGVAETTDLAGFDGYMMMSVLHSIFHSKKIGEILFIFFWFFFSGADFFFSGDFFFDDFQIHRFAAAAKAGLIAPPAQLPKVSTTPTKPDDDDDELFEEEENDEVWTWEKNAEAAVGKKPKLWRLNLRELRQRRLRSVCLDVVEAKANTTVRKVAEILFDLGAWHYDDDDDDEELTILVDPEIRKRMKREGVGLSTIESDLREKYDRIQFVRGYIDHLRNDAAQFVTIVEGSNPTAYLFQAKHAVDHVRMKLIRHYLTSRYDDATARLYAVLHMHQLIDQSDLAERALMPPKDAREKLYKMLQDGLIDLVDLSGGGSSKGESHYLWRVDPAKTTAVVLSHVRAALRNLLIRRTVTSGAALDRIDHAILQLHHSDASLFQDPPSL